LDPAAHDKLARLEKEKAELELKTNEMLKDFEKALEDKDKEKSKSAINFDAFAGANRRNTT